MRFGAAFAALANVEMADFRSAANGVSYQHGRKLLRLTR
jgi:hypothetical protein